LGKAYAAEEEFSTAIDLWRQALALARAIGNRRMAAAICWNLGEADEKTGAYAQAAEYMQQCVDYEQEAGQVAVEERARHLADVRAKAAAK
jgi:tetratricopeptide (TPR) repeat protein